MGKSKHAIPIVTHSRVLQMIHTYHRKYTNFKKSYKRDNTKAFQTKIKSFRQEACTKLFDIAVCKCITFEDCTCERTKKLLQNEHNFLKDQRTTRLLYNGSLEINETKGFQNIADRKAQNLYLNHTQATPNAGYIDYEDEETDCSPDISTVDLNLDTYKPTTSNHLISLTDPKYKQLTPFASKSSQMRLGLPSTAVVGDRCKVSDRAVDAIASSALHGFGVITSNNSDLVVKKTSCELKRLKLERI
ncbi:hypothetical protein AVEN_212643-1 [Araneus ventricosus]|uniref:Uncharacterized protein n=1 Tax=Araneus ventricosus TaxID=182803 RepID=A0A4Y2M888_ARAVE|nr:hypothetical protein AVEN_212643-1 [Araneus ventricosus]